MTAILAAEIADKWFRQAFTPRCGHECVLQFAEEATDIERPVTPSHPFEIDGTHS
jgi:hypothetical protein